MNKGPILHDYKHLARYGLGRRHRLPIEALQALLALIVWIVIMGLINGI